eukprot:scaffold14883_cov72-Skeletonema_dohrnii-CCMP3373.AAC.2
MIGTLFSRMFSRMNVSSYARWEQNWVAAWAQFRVISKTLLLVTPCDNDPPPHLVTRDSIDETMTRMHSPFIPCSVVA